MVAEIGDLSEEVGRSNERTEQVEKTYKEDNAQLRKDNEALAPRVTALEAKFSEQTGAASGLVGRTKALETGQDAVNQLLRYIQ